MSLLGVTATFSHFLFQNISGILFSCQFCG